MCRVRRNICIGLKPAFSPFWSSPFLPPFAFDIHLVFFWIGNTNLIFLLKQPLFYSLSCHSLPSMKEMDWPFRSQLSILLRRLSSSTNHIGSIDPDGHLSVFFSDSVEEKKENSFPFVGYVILEPLCLFIQLDWIQQQENSFRKIPVVLYVDQTRIESLKDWSESTLLDGLASSASS